MALTQTYSGRALYVADFLERPHRLFAAISCRIGQLPFRFEGLLDTGSEWCVMRADVARRFRPPLPGAEATVMLTRFGSIVGHVQRVPITFPALEGEELTVDATWFVSEEWPGPMVIGWKGCLERIRFALDPSDESFYFGEY